MKKKLRGSSFYLQKNTKHCNKGVPMSRRIGIIGGSGLYQLSPTTKPMELTNDYGVVVLNQFLLEGKEVYFLPRHGPNHFIPPHKINYRANLRAFKDINVDCIISTSAVGSIKDTFKPGMFGYFEQFIDFTKKRFDTYADSFEDGICHPDMTNPYDPDLNHQLDDILQQNNIPFEASLTLVVTEGPRFESPAEIRAFKLLGGDAVGMTGYPEVALAKELGIPFCGLAISTNFAAGVSKTPLSHEEVVEQMKISSETLKIILMAFIKQV
jgi:5'-methylthioadenosine phosphorylase